MPIRPGSAGRLVGFGLLAASVVHVSAGGHTHQGLPDIPPGLVLFQERFDDDAFASRGWYDGARGTIRRTEHAPGSAAAFECAFVIGAQSCAGGTPARRQFEPTDTVYASFWIRFSANWVGSGRGYHPHMFHFINDLDVDHVGPARAHLTTPDAALRPVRDVAVYRAGVARRANLLGGRAHRGHRATGLATRGALKPFVG